MPPRKKKVQKPSETPTTTTAKSKGKTKAKKTVKPPKPPKVAVPPKKRAPVKKTAQRKPRVKKVKDLSVKPNENIDETIDKINENVGEITSEELSTNLTEIPCNTVVENQDVALPECGTSMDLQPMETEESTCELSEKLEHLEVRDEKVIDEIIEFDSVDNVITVDYVSQDVTVENENSNLSNVEMVDNITDNEKEKKLDEIDNTMNEIEQNLSLMMSENDSMKLDDSETNVIKHETQIKQENEPFETDSKSISFTEDSSVKLPEDVKEVKIEDVESIPLKIEPEPEVELEMEKKTKSKTKKQTEPKPPKPPKKESKKKEKSKLKPKSKAEEIDDSSIRRSSRIKSISVLKKPSVGHGLVRIKENELLETQPEIEKPTPPQTPPVLIQPVDKPIKVKSRWRRSSELEMNVSNTAAVLNANLKLNEPVEMNSEKDKTNAQVKDELVESRLKQFVHLKENFYLTERFVCKEAKKMTCDCFLTNEEIGRGAMACGEDCLNRLLMIECGNLCQVGDRCANKKFQKGQFAPVEVFNTHKKGLGLRAAANIPYGEFILEYIGEVLNANEFDKRAEEYSQDKNQHYYFMSLRNDAIIDATQKGNISRFINHSCEPNAETQKWTVNGELRIGFFSTRTILAGEEVTFDYRFERYGKEAQKCFCEAPSCRGWLGEEPDEDEEEEEEEIEETIEEKAPEETAAKDEPLESTGEAVPEAEKKVEVTTPVVTKVKKPKGRRKLMKEMFEDDQLDEEIEMLITTGLKNQAHTLKLSRLMLRAKEPAQRTKLLKVLRRGELPCRRLFLDYHGLRLMHGYMTDAQHLCKTDNKYDSLRLEMLQTLAVLPIPNKTMLQDSKVLPTVEKWSIPLTSDSPLDSDSNSPRIEAEPNPSPVPTPIPQVVKPTEETSCDSQMDDTIRRSVGMNEMKSEAYFTNTSGLALAEEIVNIFEDDTYVPSPKLKPVEIKPQLPNYEEEITALASKLLEAWSNLKEVFRIPKKERIEQMKEHEREANKGYIAGLGLEQYAEKKNESRYRGMQRTRPLDKKNIKPEERFPPPGMLSKHNRRKLFALQVEQQEEERRRKQRELWRQHERNCMLIGTDPRFTAPFDMTRGFQCIWNPQIGQWQNYPLPPESQNPMAYGHMSNMQNLQSPVSLPNTNVPPPNITPTSSYPFGIPQNQMATGVPVSSRNLPPMMSPITVGRPSIQPTPPLPLPHQLTPSNVPTIPPNIHQPGVNMYQATGYSPQMMVGQSPSPVVYQQEKKGEVISMIGDVQFMGPLPPPAKLPPKWKCAKDKYGRPYYYHIRYRKPQWEPPLLDVQPEDDSDSSSSDSSSLTSDSSSNDSDSEDEIINDSKLLRQVRRQMDRQLQVATPPKKKIPKEIPVSVGESSTSTNPVVEVKTEVEEAVTESPQTGPSESETSIDRRLKEQFNLMDDEGPPAKKKRTSLVQEIIISPRTEDDKIQFRHDLKRYKENKEMLKKQKEIILQQTKKHIKEKKLKQQQSKEKLREMKYSNSENAKRIKENFRSSMANTVVSALNVYRKADCKEGRITNTEDFKHLARKLTHFVMLKEMKYISEIDELVCSDNVKAKARDYIRKYMGKFGEIYIKRDDEPEHYY